MWFTVPPGAECIVTPVLFGAREKRAEELWKELRKDLSEQELKVEVQKIDTIPLDKHSLRTLLPKRWINDEVINAYVVLLNARAEQQKTGNFVFNT
jgi:Ulp1 family protease